MTSFSPILPLRQRGFTLIEIIAVLIILGVLASIAVPKYFDLMADSDRKAAASSVAEAQSRMLTLIGKGVLLGMSCSDARALVNNTAYLGDKAVHDWENGTVTTLDNQIGLFYLTTENDGAVSLAGSRVLASKEKEGTPEDIALYLYLPQCDLADADLGKKSLDDLITNLMTGNYHTAGMDLFALTGTLPNGISYKYQGIATDGMPIKKASVVYTDANGNKILELQFRYDPKTGKVYVGLFNVPGAGNLVHDSGAEVSAKKIELATAALKQVGLDPAHFANILKEQTFSKTHSDAVSDDRLYIH